MLDEFPQLAERLDNAGGSLSGGEQQMLAIGRALMANPSLILMDEPSEGPVAQAGAARRGDHARLCARAATPSCWWSRTSRSRSSVADRIHVISSGRFVFDGTPDELNRNAGVLDSHLGVAAAQVH